MKINKHIAGRDKENWYASTLVTNTSVVCLACLLMIFLMGKSPQDLSQGLFVSIFIALVFTSLASGFPFTRQLKQLIPFGQKDFIVAKEAGITLEGNGALPSQFRLWEQIAEVVLTKKFSVVYTNGKLQCRHVAIIFLSGQFEDTTSPAVSWGTGVAKSASGRLYMSADFPDGDWRKFELAVRKFAPDWVAIKVCNSTTFDRNTGTDYLIEA